MADNLLHLVVPILAVAGWLAIGPRPRVDGRAVAIAFAWPLAWLVWTLLIGATTGWFPYPFLDWHQKGGVAVAVVCVAVTALFAGLFWLASYADRRLRPMPR